jgi:hypothetical protein
MLVKRLLHSKMESIMGKYADISSAFSQIKSNTSVKSVDQFIIRFLNKNQIYGELLDSISKLEPKIDLLEEERKMLEEEHAKLLF